MSKKGVSKKEANDSQQFSDAMATSIAILEHTMEAVQKFPIEQAVPDEFDPRALLRDAGQFAADVMPTDPRHINLDTAALYTIEQRIEPFMIIGMKFVESRDFNTYVVTISGFFGTRGTFTMGEGSDDETIAERNKLYQFVTARITASGPFKLQIFPTQYKNPFIRVLSMSRQEFQLSMQSAPPAPTTVEQDELPF